MKTVSILTAMFESNKQDLKKDLRGLVISKDAEKIQRIVSNYLNVIFDRNGDFRLSLNQSEDCVLQSALSLLNAQQKMIKEMIVKCPIVLSPCMTNQVTGINRESYPKILTGTTVGGLAGTFLGTWGALFGAIAGTAIMLYYTSQRSVSVSEDRTSKSLEEAEINSLIFLDIIEQICKSVDELIDTFRIQINRVVVKYENQDKPTLENQYKLLLKKIHSLLGSAYADSTENGYLERLQCQCDDIANTLRIYGLRVIRYDGSKECEDCFEIEEDAGVNGIMILYPAIIRKNGEIVELGKVLIEKK